MATPDERRSELIAAAVADQLDSGERAELDVLRAADASIDREIDSMRSMLRAVTEASPSWEHVEADATLRERILGDAKSARSSETAPPSEARPLSAARADASVSPLTAVRGPRRRLWMPALAAACLAIGIGVGVALPPVLSAAPDGPPGTLGAIEAVDVRDELAGASIDAEIIAHTWGTETILDAEGLDVGATYSIVLVDADGTEFSAGEMLGSDVPIHCSLNAAVLRQEVVRLEVRDREAAVIAVADLPSV